MKPEIRSFCNRVIKHSAIADFWDDYRSLPADIRARADKQFGLLKDNPPHPSPQFKKIGDRIGQEIWSARVTLKYRASAVKLVDEYVWCGSESITFTRLTLAEGLRKRRTAQ